MWKSVIEKNNLNADTQGGRIKLVQTSTKSDLSQHFSTGVSNLKLFNIIHFF